MEKIIIGNGKNNYVIAKNLFKKGDVIGVNSLNIDDVILKRGKSDYKVIVEECPLIINQEYKDDIKNKNIAKFVGKVVDKTNLYQIHNFESLDLDGTNFIGDVEISYSKCSFEDIEIEEIFDKVKGTRYLAIMIKTNIPKSAKKSKKAHFAIGKKIISNEDMDKKDIYDPSFQMDCFFLDYGTAKEKEIFKSYKKDNLSGMNIEEILKIEDYDTFKKEFLSKQIQSSLTKLVVPEDLLTDEKSDLLKYIDHNYDQIVKVLEEYNNLYSEKITVESLVRKEKMSTIADKISFFEEKIAKISGIKDSEVSKRLNDIINTRKKLSLSYFNEKFLFEKLVSGEEISLDEYSSLKIDELELDLNKIFEKYFENEKTKEFMELIDLLSEKSFLKSDISYLKEIFRKRINKFDIKFKTLDLKEKIDAIMSSIGRENVVYDQLVEVLDEFKDEEFISIDEYSIIDGKIESLKSKIKDNLLLFKMINNEEKKPYKDDFSMDFHLNYIKDFLGYDENMLDLIKHYIEQNTYSREFHQYIPDKSILWNFIDADSYLIRIIMKILSGSNALRLVGPASTGKNTMLEVVAFILQKPIMELSGSINTDTDDFKGQMQLINGDTNFQSSNLIKAMENGLLYVLDEINGVLPNVLIHLHSLLDDRGRLNCEAYNNGNNGLVRSKPGFVFASTMNIGYEGVQDLNEAFITRMKTLKISKSPTLRDVLMSLEEYKNYSSDKNTEFMETLVKLYEFLKNSIQSNTNLDIPEYVLAFRRYKEAFKEYIYTSEYISPEYIVEDNILSMINDEDTYEAIKTDFFKK